MTLIELAEAQLPKRDSRWKLGEAACILCESDEVVLWRNEVICAGCHSRICVLCGCVDEMACTGGCFWMFPGICSSHNGDRRLAALSVPATPVQALGLLN
jgi:hypothetical protein